VKSPDLSGLFLCPEKSEKNFQRFSGHKKRNER